MSHLARSRPLSGSSQAILATAGIYRGVTLHESGGTNPVTVVLYDNATTNSGTIIGAFTLAAGASVDVDRLDVWVENGIFVDKSGSGTLVGSVRVG